MMTRAVHIILRLTISSGEKPTTVREWTLCSEGGTMLSNPYVGFDEAKGYQYIRLEVRMYSLAFCNSTDVGIQSNNSSWNLKTTLVVDIKSPFQKRYIRGD